jgi:hypothetical protein
LNEEVLLDISPQSLLWDYRKYARNVADFHRWEHGDGKSTDPEFERGRPGGTRRKTGNTL